MRIDHAAEISRPFQGLLETLTVQEMLMTPQERFYDFPLLGRIARELRQWYTLNGVEVTYFSYTALGCFRYQIQINHETATLYQTVKKPLADRARLSAGCASGG